MTQAVHRAFRVLEALVANAPDAAPGHIAKEVGLPTSTTFRILQTLVADDYAVALDGGRYRAGPKVLTLAGQMMVAMDHSVAARPAMLRLQEFTPETVHFGMLVGDHAQYVDKLESRRPYRLASVPGMALPLYCTSIGKAILAHLPEAHAARLIDATELVARTPRTLTDPDRLRVELEWIREHGFAIDDEEDREGVRCLAAPVFDQRGDVLGAVSVSAPAVHLSFTEATALAPRVIEAAQDISLALGASPAVLDRPENRS